MAWEQRAFRGEDASRLDEIPKADRIVLRAGEQHSAAVVHVQVADAGTEESTTLSGQAETSREILDVQTERIYFAVNI